MPTMDERDADFLHALGLIRGDLAAALKAEARRRLDSGTFFGHLAHASLVARRRQR